MRKWTSVLLQHQCSIILLIAPWISFRKPSLTHSYSLWFRRSWPYPLILTIGMWLRLGQSEQLWWCHSWACDPSQANGRQPSDFAGNIGKELISSSWGCWTGHFCLPVERPILLIQLIQRKTESRDRGKQIYGLPLSFWHGLCLNTKLPPKFFSSEPLWAEANYGCVYVTCNQKNHH